MTKLLVAYYGDDFTGSADVMEVLQWAGLRTVLFLDPPTLSDLAKFHGLRAFGVAGWSRTMSPAEMESELPPAFESLRASGAAFVHYKTCSTFDSSPEIGSIGRAIEMGRRVFGTDVVPIVIGAPNLARYQVFGNLFARSGLDTDLFRLDRHPTMRQHPITPMVESDLRVHLAAQTELKIGLIDVLDLNQSTTPTSAECEIPTGYDAILFDVLYPEHLRKIGAAIHNLADRDTPKFVVGSSGIEYSLAEHWLSSGQLESFRSRPTGYPKFSAAEPLVVITGSCSPVNGRQVSWAEKNGFETLAINTAQLIASDTAANEIASLVARAVSRIKAGANVLLHSSRGPDDSRVTETMNAFRSQGHSDLDIRLRSGRALGPQLGRILSGILSECRMARVGVAGGDTSGYVARELGINALEAIAPIAPGSPLCRAHADNQMDGIEFFFKGGQVGKDDVWDTLLNGTA